MDSSEDFGTYRENYSLKSPNMPETYHEDEKKLMNSSDGLQKWIKKNKISRIISEDDVIQFIKENRDIYLWVIGKNDVVHAREKCDFGRALSRGVIKHTNLTGGEPAYSGGEIIFLNETSIVLNGSSGRYGPQSGEEMEMIALCFSKTGYTVWCMGYDPEAKRPVYFDAGVPFLVSEQGNK